MEFTLYISTITIILVQLLKRAKFLDANYLPYISCGIGGCLGALFGVYYGGDLFFFVFYGIVAGATASGIYDLGKSGADIAKGPKV